MKGNRSQFLEENWCLVQHNLARKLACFRVQWMMLYFDKCASALWKWLMNLQIRDAASCTMWKKFWRIWDGFKARNKLSQDFPFNVLVHNRLAALMRSCGITVQKTDLIIGTAYLLRCEEFCQTGKSLYSFKFLAFWADIGITCRRRS